MFSTNENLEQQPLSVVDDAVLSCLKEMRYEKILSLSQNSRIDDADTINRRRGENLFSR